MTSSFHLAFSIYRYPFNDHLAFTNENTNAKHFQSLKIENCKMKITSEGGLG